MLNFSCIGIKGSGKGGKYVSYETYFINDSTIQYFIKPLKFKNKDFIFEVDFTYREIHNEGDGVTSNFTIIHEKQYDFNEIWFVSDSCL